MPQNPRNEVRSGNRTIGRVVRLNKGFGFIEGPDGVDYFFHYTDVDKFSKQFRNLTIGDKVEYSPGRTDHGPRAFSVCSTNGDSPE